jgi:RNA polymerase sigma factor (TIGR02999 family)
MSTTTISYGQFAGFQALACSRMLEPPVMAEHEPHPPGPPDVTALLQAWGQGDAANDERLMELLYGEMRRLARYQMRSERRGGTLQTTALVHEVYIRLFQSPINWHDRKHFFAVANQTMRRVLIDYARARSAAKREGGVRVELENERLISDDRVEQILLVDELLGSFGKLYPRAGQIVEFHVFSGFTLAEIADVLDVSERTVKRDWEFAKAWLFEAMRPKAKQ